MKDCTYTMAAPKYLTREELAEAETLGRCLAGSTGPLQKRPNIDNEPTAQDMCHSG